MASATSSQTAAQLPARDSFAHHEFATSNSTSQLFLGQARKPWMAGASSLVTGQIATLGATRTANCSTGRAQQAVKPMNKTPSSKAPRPSTMTVLDGVEDTSSTALMALEHAPAADSGTSVVRPRSSSQVPDTTQRDAEVPVPVEILSTGTRVDADVPITRDHPSQEEAGELSPVQPEPRNQLLQGQTATSPNSLNHQRRTQSEQLQASEPNLETATAVPNLCSNTTNWANFRVSKPLRFTTSSIPPAMERATLPPSRNPSTVAAMVPHGVRSSTEARDSSTSTFNARPTNAGAGSIGRKRPFRLLEQDGQPDQVPISSSPEQNGPSPPAQPASGAQTVSTANTQPQQTAPSTVWPVSSANPYPQLLSAVLDPVRARNRFSDYDEQRVVLLREACYVQDVHYLILHQMYVLAYTKPAVLGQFKFGAAENAGLHVLQMILVHNANINQELLLVCGQFPPGFRTLTESAINKIIEQVKEFLRALGSGWEGLRIRCLQSGFPPCVQELVAEISVRSPSMQKALFISLHRQICSALNPTWDHRAIQLFLEDQRDYAQRSRNDDTQPSLQQILTFRNKYLLARRAFNILPPALTAPPQQRATLLRMTATTADPTNTAPQGLIHTGNRPASSDSNNSCTLDSMFVPDRPPLVAFQAQSRPMTESRTNVPNTAISPNAAPAMPRQAQSRGMRRINALLSVQPRSQSEPGLLMPLLSSLYSSIESADFRKELLLPRHGYQTPPTTHPDPNRLALHQAYLREPDFRKVDGRWNNAPDLRLYQFTSEFCYISDPITASTRFKSLQFDISPEQFGRRIRDSASQDTFSVNGPRIFGSGANLFRLRCSTIADPSTLIIRPLDWPSCFFLSFNDQPDLEVRRKLHWGRDLPVDLTRFVRAGTNSLRISYHPLPAEKDKTFYLAIDIVRVADHQFALTLAAKLPPDQALASLTSALTQNQDEELSFADPHLSIDLIDPFTATVWTTPVRGRDCKHRECFDHDAFLRSRPSSSSSRVGEQGSNGLPPTDPDKWRCPICGLDARPCSLVVDGFLLWVREKLSEQGRIDNARAILLKEDGSWEVKTETLTNKEDKVGRSSRKPTPAIADAKVDVNGMSNGGETVVNGTAGARGTENPTRSTSDPVATAAGPMEVVEIIDDD